MPLTYKNKSAFTLVELIVVIAIIAILSSIVIVSLSGVRQKTRDLKRVSDVKTIQTALQMYATAVGFYPEFITANESIVNPNNGTVYLANVPTNPIPKNDGNCGNNDYTYVASADKNDYVINFCLGDTASRASRGSNLISKNGLNIAPGLVAWWKFEEGSNKHINDVTGNDNTCDISDGSKIDYFWTDLGNCKTGGCGQFDGTNDLYVDCGIKNNFVINSGSISLWFNIRSQMNGPYNFNIIQLGNSAADNNIGLRLEAGTAKLVGYKNSSQIIDLSIPEIKNNTWYYVVATWDASGANLYVEGPDKDVNVNNGGDARLGFVNDNTEVKIGAEIADLSENFDGYIDDVRLYNRVLSVNEIQAVYGSLK